MAKVKRLVLSRLHGMHESKFAFVSRIEFFRSKLSNFSAHVSVAAVSLSSPFRFGACTWGDMVYMVTVPNTCFKGGNKRPCCMLDASF